LNEAARVAASLVSVAHCAHKHADGANPVIIRTQTG